MAFHLEGDGIELRGSNLVARDADLLEVADQRLELAKDADCAALRGQGTLGHAVLDHDTPTARLANYVGTAYRAGFDQAGERDVIDGIASRCHNVTFRGCEL